LPPVGIDLDLPPGVEIGSAPPGNIIAVLLERSGPRAIAAARIELVAVRLIIDRDGALAELAAREAPGSHPYPVEYTSGAAGFRVDAVLRSGELRYRSWIALAPFDVGGGGAVLVTIESEAVEWRAGAHLLSSLRVLARDAEARAPTDVGGVTPLPLIKPSGS
jgi:hypothetical protein